jgi:hypothetical protein
LTHYFRRNPQSILALFKSYTLKVNFFTQLIMKTK